MVDKFVAGAGSAYSVGATGGENSVVLNDTQIPSHNHTITDPGHNHIPTDPQHTHTEHSAQPDRQTSGGGAADGASEYFNRTTAPASTGITINNNITGITITNNTGGGQPHENRPPYFALIYLMRII